MKKKREDEPEKNGTRWSRKGEKFTGSRGCGYAAPPNTDPEEKDGDLVRGGSTNDKTKKEGEEKNIYYPDKRKPVSNKQSAVKGANADSQNTRHAKMQPTQKIR